MGSNSTDPFTKPTISGYNSTPPPDDGTEVAGNIVGWADFVIAKVGDPVKILAEAIATNADAAFGQVLSLANDIRNALSAQVSLDASELTISSGGAVTPTRSYHTVDTTNDDASDNLDTLTVGSAAEGTIVMISANNSARTVVCRHGSGNLSNAYDDSISLDDAEKSVIYQLRGATWYEMTRSSVATRISNIAKAFATFSYSAGTPSVDIGFNVDTGTVDDDGVGTIGIHFSITMSTSTYGVFGNGLENQSLMVSFLNRTTTAVDTRISNDSGANEDRDISFMLMGDI